MVDVVTYILGLTYRIEKKDFESLPNIHCFLNNVKEEEGKPLFQDVKGFDNAKTIIFQPKKCAA